MTSTHRAAAEDFLGTDVVALEPAAGRRLVTSLSQFLSGGLDRDGLRAALGGEPTTSRHTAQFVSVIPLTGVLTPVASIFTMLGVGTSVAEFMRNPV